VGSRLSFSIEHFYAYMAGFLDGDGCITVKIERSITCRLGFRARVRVSFTQHRSRRRVLDLLQKKICSGRVIEYDHNNMAEYVINDQKVISRLLDRLEPYVFVKSEHLKLAKKIFVLRKEGYSKRILNEMLIVAEKVRSLNNYPKEKLSLTP